LQFKGLEELDDFALPSERVISVRKYWVKRELWENPSSLAPTTVNTAYIQTSPANVITFDGNTSAGYTAILQLQNLTNDYVTVKVSIGCGGSCIQRRRWYERGVCGVCDYLT